MLVLTFVVALVLLLGVHRLQAAYMRVASPCEHGEIGEQQVFQFKDAFPNMKMGDLIIDRDCWLKQ